jgi:hypothetical protein
VPDLFRTPKRGPGKKSGNMEFQSGMRAATANVTVHAIVYFIDFLNLKKITFIENKQTFLWKEQETETRLCCKEIWQEYGTFLRDNIAKQKWHCFIYWYSIKLSWSA